MFLLRRLLESVFLKPLAWILLLLLVLIFWKRRWARKLLMLTVLLIALLHSGPVAHMVQYSLESRYPPVPDPTQLGAYDAIVVLNGDVIPATGLIAQPSLGVSTFRRLEEALRLYRMRPVPIIVSGGPDRPASASQNKNKIVAGYLVRWGVPADGVIPEPKSEDTYESAREVRKILLAKGWHRYLLVTSAAHMPRAMLVFQRLAPEPIAASGDFNASTSSNPLSLLFGEGSAYETNKALHEFIGIIFYRFRLWREPQ